MQMPSFVQYFDVDDSDAERAIQHADRRCKKPRFTHLSFDTFDFATKIVYSLKMPPAAAEPVNIAAGRYFSRDDTAYFDAGFAGRWARRRCQYARRAKFTACRHAIYWPSRPPKTSRVELDGACARSPPPFHFHYRYHDNFQSRAENLYRGHHRSAARPFYRRRKMSPPTAISYADIDADVISPLDLAETAHARLILMSRQWRLISAIIRSCCGNARRRCEARKFRFTQCPLSLITDFDAEHFMPYRHPLFGAHARAQRLLQRVSMPNSTYQTRHYPVPRWSPAAMNFSTD